MFDIANGCSFVVGRRGLLLLPSAGGGCFCHRRRGLLFVIYGGLSLKGDVFNVDKMGMLLFPAGVGCCSLPVGGGCPCLRKEGLPFDFVAGMRASSTSLTGESCACHWRGMFVILLSEAGGFCSGEFVLVIGGLNRGAF